MKNYILIGQTPVEEPDVLVWARWFGEEDRVVQRTSVFSAEVSTVFLGLDHNFFQDGPPLLFETMVFWEGESGYEQERCSTWMEAQEQHARMCEQVAMPGSVLLYIGRCLTEFWDQAKSDLRERWRELREGG